MRRAPLAALGAAALALTIAPAFAGGNQTSGVTLHPNGFGENSYAAWKGHEGESDRVGNGDHALYLQKHTATATNAAGVAVFNGIENAGLEVGGLHLAFDVRDDGWCGAGAPRFNITVDNGGQRSTVFVGCQEMTESSGSEPGWHNRSITLPDDAPGDVVGLAIVFDEGNDVGPGHTWLDNIEVDDLLWTGPADNSQN